MRAKYELICSHTARRSGTTNLYKLGVLPAPSESTKDRKRTQNESFYPILLVGMNNFCTFAKVMTVTVTANTILSYEVLR